MVWVIAHGLNLLHWQASILCFVAFLKSKTINQGSYHISIFSPSVWYTYSIPTVESIVKRWWYLFHFFPCYYRVVIRKVENFLDLFCCLLLKL